MTINPHGAHNTITGFVSTNATWDETFELTQPDGPITGFADDEWEFTFRKCDGSDTHELTLSTTDGTLIYTEYSVLDDIDETALQILVPAETVSLCGDYFADLKSTSDDDYVTHWGHGRVTFQNNP